MRSTRAVDVMIQEMSPDCELLEARREGRWDWRLAYLIVLVEVDCQGITSVCSGAVVGHGVK